MCNFQDQDSNDEDNAPPDDDTADLENEDLDSYDGSSHGSIPDSHDSRDKAFIPAKPTSPPIRPAGHKGVDLRSYCPDVYDQGNMMSCTPNAVAAAFEFEVMKQNLPSFVPSRLFIWYNARAKTNIRDATLKNCGCSIREAIKSLDMRSHGVCSEEDWSYEVAKADKKTLYFVNGAKAAKRPPRVVYQHAHQHTAPKYFSFQSKGNRLLNDLINCLDRGYPFVFGMSTYGLLKNVKSDGEGLKMPTQNMNGKPKHGHALMAVGYHPDRRRFIVRNSWGENWGDNGYFTMSYKYMTSNHCYDFWTVRLVSGKPKNNAVRLITYPYHNSD
jgi:C1A family cysteine protease